MRILFVSRAYPPVIGGIENQNRDLALWLGKKADLRLIANTRGKTFLPIFLPYAFFKALIFSFSSDILLVGDGVLAPLAAAVGILHPGLKTAAVVHGLDLTFGRRPGFLSRFYRSVNLPSLRRLDRIFAVSGHTREVAIKSGIEPKRITVIRNGIDPSELVTSRRRDLLDRLVGVPTENRFVILRIGRYVEHKGVEWFIRNVVPKLPEKALFVAAGSVVGKRTAGDNDYFPTCERTVGELGLDERVRLLTNLPQADILTLLNASDLAVSPNIPVPGTMEGFGINVIEANACGLPVIAADLE
ncbi:MAG: glycosyltransferase family 4 protein, partial [Candidatus Moranbacteria bacterium]|nr:glycosyltransferase family 4 protein [Candidatus Moranbacteria bacterium]